MLMGKGNDGSGWSMSVEPRGRSELPKASLSKRAAKKKEKWANIEKEARKRPRPPDLSDPVTESFIDWLSRLAPSLPDCSSFLYCSSSLGHSTEYFSRVAFSDFSRLSCVG